MLWGFRVHVFTHAELGSKPEGQQAPEGLPAAVLIQLSDENLRGQN